MKISKFKCEPLRYLSKTGVIINCCNLVGKNCIIERFIGKVPLPDRLFFYVLFCMNYFTYSITGVRPLLTNRFSIFCFSQLVTHFCLFHIKCPLCSLLNNNHVKVFLWFGYIISFLIIMYGVWFLLFDKEIQRLKNVTDNLNPKWACII